MEVKETVYYSHLQSTTLASIKARMTDKVKKPPVTHETVTYRERVRQAIQLSTGEPGMLYHEEDIDYS